MHSENIWREVEGWVPVNIFPSFIFQNMLFSTLSLELSSCFCVLQDDCVNAALPRAPGLQGDAAPGIIIIHLPGQTSPLDNSMVHACFLFLQTQAYRDAIWLYKGVPGSTDSMELFKPLPRELCMVIWVRDDRIHFKKRLAYQSTPHPSFKTRNSTKWLSEWCAKFEVHYGMSHGDGASKVFKITKKSGTEFWPIMSITQLGIKPLCCWRLIWPIQNDAKPIKMTETQANGYP